MKRIIALTALGSAALESAVGCSGGFSDTGPNAPGPLGRALTSGETLAHGLRLPPHVVIANEVQSDLASESQLSLLEPIDGSTLHRFSTGDPSTLCSPMVYAALGFPTKLNASA